jgi:transposase InsO family protein
MGKDCPPVTASPRPNQLWVSDFTYVSTWQGWLYVAFVIDVFARRIVGWRVSSSTRQGKKVEAMLCHAAGQHGAFAAQLNDARQARAALTLHLSEKGLHRASP